MSVSWKMQRLGSTTLLRSVRNAASASKNSALSRAVALSTKSAASVYAPTDTFINRHMGSQGADRQAMLDKVGFSTMEALVDSTIPPQIRLTSNLVMDAPLSESEALKKIKVENMGTEHCCEYQHMVDQSKAKQCRVDWSKSEEKKRKRRAVQWSTEKRSLVQFGQQCEQGVVKCWYYRDR